MKTNPTTFATPGYVRACFFHVLWAGLTAMFFSLLAPVGQRLLFPWAIDELACQLTGSGGIGQRPIYKERLGSAGPRARRREGWTYLGGVKSLYIICGQGTVIRLRMRADDRPSQQASQ